MITKEDIEMILTWFDYCILSGMNMTKDDQELADKLCVIVKE